MLVWKMICIKFYFPSFLFSLSMSLQILAIAVWNCSFAWCFMQFYWKKFSDKRDFFDWKIFYSSELIRFISNRTDLEQNKLENCVTTEQNKGSQHLLYCSHASLLVWWSDTTRIWITKKILLWLRIILIIWNLMKLFYLEDDCAYFT